MLWLVQMDKVLEQGNLKFIYHLTNRIFHIANSKWLYSKNIYNPLSSYKYVIIIYNMDSFVFNAPYFDRCMLSIICWKFRRRIVSGIKVSISGGLDWKDHISLVKKMSCFKGQLFKFFCRLMKFKVSPVSDSANVTTVFYL